MPNIFDVARLARVSIATVSRVTNQSPHKVNAVTKKRVLEAIRELDYRPNALAKGLLIKKTMTIGVIIPDISNPYYAEMVRGIQDLADQQGYAVMLQNTDRRQDRIINYIYLLREKAADGVIFGGGILSGEKVLETLKEIRERVVVIGRHKVALPAVTIDNSGGAIEAAQHLIDLGHQKIGFIGGPEKSPTARDRFQGFLKTMHRNGCSTDPHWIQQGDFTPVSGYRIAQGLLARNPRPTAIFAANDQMAFGAVKAAKEAKLSVPEDLSIVGFDNIPLCCYFDPPLTTVEIPIYSLGYAAMGMLVNLISGKTTESLKSFKTKLVVRGSTMKQEFMRGGTG